MWCWEKELPILETKITASKPVDNVYQYHSDSFGNHIRTVNENWQYFFIVWKTIPNTEYLLGIKRNQWEAFNSDEKEELKICSDLRYCKSFEASNVFELLIKCPVMGKWWMPCWKTLINWPKGTSVERG